MNAPRILPRREFLSTGAKAAVCLLLTGGGLPRCVSPASAAAPSEETPPRPLAELAYCGFDCETECDVRQATRDNDLEAKRRIAARWAKSYGIAIAPEKVACDGCRSTTGRLGHHCANICDVRKCGSARAVESCAVCAEFPRCDKRLWKGWTAMHERTAARRKALQARRTE